MSAKPSPILAAKQRAIFASCRQLGIADDERKALLKQIADVSSSKDLNLVQADRVLDHLRRAGAAKPGKASVKPGQHPGQPSTLARTPYLQKIEALLADMRLPWAYAESIAANITGGNANAGGIKKLAWVQETKHFRGIITALNVEKTKRLAEAWQQLNTKLAAKKLDRAWCLAQAKAMKRLNRPWRWDECLATLRLIEEQLG